MSHSSVSMQAHELIIDTTTDKEHAEAVITEPLNAQVSLAGGWLKLASPVIVVTIHQ